MTNRSLQNEDIKKRFQREAAIGRQLNHPNIVKILEFGEIDDEFFICMEFIEGETLRRLIKEGPVPPSKVIEIAIAVGEALKLAHHSGVVHRDIKPENIMLTVQDEVKVMDFGIARVQDATILTREGELLGTVAYMSPQQAIGETIDPRSDIFSLGVVLYELLTTKLPFTGEYEMAMLYSILNEEPLGIRELNPDVPQILEQVVNKALKKDLQERYQDIEEFTSDLKKVKAFLEAEEEMTPEGLQLVATAELGRLEERGFLAKLVGRNAQFETLKSLLKSTSMGESQTVLISGEAGVGKTRLVWELEKYASTLKVRVLKGRCLFGKGGYPFQPFVEAIRWYFDIKGVRNAEKLENFVQEKAPDLRPLLPFIRVFLNLKDEQGVIIESKDQLWEALLKLIVEISRERPLILFIDDLHWADEDMLNLFYFIARNTAYSKVMMIGTYRPEDVQEKIDGQVHSLIGMQHELSREGIAVRIHLNRLNKSDILEMTASLFENSNLGEAFYETLYKETEGNPLFVIETLKLFKAESIIQKEDGGYRLQEGYDRMTIPGKVHDIIMRRIERLNQEEREMLEIGAVEGEAFHSGVIVECLGIHRIKVLRRLQALEREHHIIHPQEKMYRFDHGKIREILYGAITPELRTEYHYLIGDYLARASQDDERIAPNIAHHYLQADEQRKALPFLITAGTRAQIVFANEQALEFYEKALHIIQDLEHPELQPPLTENKKRVLEGLGDVKALTGQHEDALNIYDQVANLEVLSPVQRVEILWKISNVHISKGEYEKALKTNLQAEEQLKAQLPHTWKKDADEQIASKDIEQERFPTILGKIRISRSRIYKAQGSYENAKKEIETGLQLLKEEGSIKEKSQAFNDFGNILFDQGVYEQAAEMYSQSLELRKQISDKKGIAEAYNNLGIVYCEKGDYEKSEKMLKKSIQIMKEIGFRIGIAGTYNNLGTIYKDQGKYREALDIYQKSLRICEEMENLPNIALTLSNLGSVCLDLKKFDQATEYLEKCLELLREIEMRVYEPQASVWLSEAYLELSQTEKAEKTARNALEIAREFNQRASQAFAERMLGRIELRKVTRKNKKQVNKTILNKIQQHLNISLKIFEELRMEHEIGRSCLELAEFFKLTRNAIQAQKSISRAREIFQKLGAKGDLEKANKLMEKRKLKQGVANGNF